MKTLLGATLAAVMLAGPAMATTLSQPAATPLAGVQIANMVSTPFTYGTGDSQATPTFNYQDSVPVSAVGPVANSSSAAFPDGTLALVNRTGGGR
ncbi:MAG TPA: hypothetical protein VMF62_12020 [Acetobacteraceae bacterium]|jgi:hypothetical protein|nr:hypothetical protein [Acetobacteraceae bacterium]